jgi:hypothetical protein
MDQRALKVVFIGGATRSGSTIVADLIAQPAGVVHAGELANIWQWGYLESRLCGCGTPFLECEFWNEVSRRAFGVESKAVPASDLRRLQLDIKKLRVLVPLFIPVLRTTSYRRRLSKYADHLSALYEAISVVAKARVVVDSSKAPHDARVLREVAGIEPHMVHLIRDSRGFTSSYRKRKVRREVHWTYRELPLHSIPRIILSWTILNLGTEIEGRRFNTFQRVSYEQFMKAPGDSLRSMALGFDEPAVASALETTGHEVSLPVSHTAAGNPSRFDRQTRLRVDDQWLHSLPVWQRNVVTAATGLLLRRYGYRLMPWREASTTADADRPSRSVVAGLNVLAASVNGKRPDTNGKAHSRDDQRHSPRLTEAGSQLPPD